jgi:hypothetical protein
MCFFSFNSSICHAVPVLLNYSVWIRRRIRIFFRIRIRQKVLDSFGFGFRTATLLHGADVACWAKKCAYLHSIQPLFLLMELTKIAPYSVIDLLRHGETKISNILNEKAFFKTITGANPQLGYRKFPAM